MNYKGSVGVVPTNLQFPWSRYFPTKVNKELQSFLNYMEWYGQWGYNKTIEHMYLDNGSTDNEHILALTFSGQHSAVDFLDSFL